MVTEIGFVSLLVAGFGGLAGALVYLAKRANDTTRRPRREEQREH